MAAIIFGASTYDVHRILGFLDPLPLLCLQNLYSAVHPLCRKVFKIRIWGIPLAGGPLLYLPTAQDTRNFLRQPLQNIATEWMNSSVLFTCIRKLPAFLKPTISGDVIYGSPLSLFGFKSLIP